MGSNLNRPPLPWALIVIFVVMSPVLLVVGFRYSSDIRKKMIDARKEELGTIADMQIDQIVQWRHEKLIDAEVIGENIPIIRQIGTCIYHKGDEFDASAIKSWMSSFVKNLDYLNANITDNKGRVRYASPANDTIIGPKMKPLIPIALKKKRVIFTDFHQVAPGQIVHLDLIIPLLLTKETDTLLIGLMLLRIDPYKKLYPLLSKWSAKSSSSETLLLRQEGDSVVYLNNLKFQKGSALTLKKSLNETNLVESKAVKGFEGIINGVDYREVPVIAATKKIPDTKWFMISKVDLAEVTQETSGEFLLIRLLIIILIAAFGAVTGWTIWHLRVRFYKDIYESRVEREALSTHFSYILKHANDIILLMDKELNIVEANDRAIEFYQYSREELIGMSIYRLRLPEFNNQLDKNLIDLNDKKAATYDAFHRRKDGKVFTLQISARLFEIEGKEYYQSIGRDITDQKNAENLLKEREFWLSESQKVGKIGSYIFNIETMIWSSSEVLDEIFGIDKDYVRSLDGWNMLVHPEDREEMLEYVKEYVIAQGNFFDKEYRIINRTTGSTQWVYGRGELSYGSDGHPIRMIGTIQDITRRKIAETDLIRAKERSEESDRLKTAFLHNISHEIRTPMNAIVGFSALLDDPAIDDLTRRNYTGIITQSTNQLLSLISDIVEISNIEAGQVKLTFNEVNINMLLLDIYNQFGKEVRKQGVEFLCETSMPDERAVIVTDKTKLIQIITNLLNNAFKFTKEGVISFGYRIKDHELVFFVRDTGIGISEDLTEKIFERFFQVESDSSRKYGGAGLGLSICKAYAELLGGKIYVSSLAGKGSEFCFIHPL